MLYEILISPFVKKMPSERASKVALRYFKIVGSIPGGRFFSRILHKNKAYGIQREVFGISFYNPLGLGAGLDLKGDLYNDLNDLGFSYVEIGPMDAQSTRHAISNIQNDPQDDILAACIGSDFLTSFTLAYDFFDFFVIDQSAELDISVLDSLIDARLTYDSYKPIVLKLPESIDNQSLYQAIDYCMMNGIDGVEARNLDQINAIGDISRHRLPVIANCHIKTPAQAQECIDAGASLVEIRSGLVTKGPSLVSKTLKQLETSAKYARESKALPSPGDDIIDKPSTDDVREND